MLKCFYSTVTCKRERDGREPIAEAGEYRRPELKNYFRRRTSQDRNATGCAASYCINIFSCQGVNLWIFAVLLVFGSMLMSGCASVNTKPYTQYAEAVKSAQKAIDQAMNTSYAWTREIYIENFTGPFSALIIKPGKEYSWSMVSPPLFMTMKKAQQKLQLLNRTFADYADLLESLASKRMAQPDRFEQLTAEMNTNAKQAWQAMGGKSADKEVLFFSIGALEISRLYLQNKQLEKLREAIQANQASVELYCEHCIELIHTLRATLKSNYPDQYQPIWKQWRKATGSDRAAVTKEMLLLNEKFIAALQMLEAIETAYQQIPKAHQDLSRTVDEAQFAFNRKSLQRLYESGKRLQQMYQELKVSK